MATARVPTMYRYAMSSLVFLDGAGHLNEPVHARPTVQSNISPTEYAYAVMHPESEKHYIRELWERARANGQYAVTYMTQPWPEGATAETVFAENRQRFLHGARFFQNSFAVIEPEMVAMIEVMRNIVFVIPEGGVAQYDRAGGRERNSSFIAAERPWAMHTVEIGETDYLALRRQLWRYVNALMDIEVRPFFRCLAGREGGVMAYECYRRGENGKGLLVQPRTMSVYSMDEI
ncbi:MAG: hypothetical protein J0L97_07805, partial [Alphaproteobacteria bacterium]|nr:hypothetical protein [Alphaproteobacteria bacterium]